MFERRYAAVQMEKTFLKPKQNFNAMIMNPMKSSSELGFQVLLLKKGNAQANYTILPEQAAAKITKN